jgi:hypothetical protein
LPGGAINGQACIPVEPSLFLMFISRREWMRHARELRKAEMRAENAERRLDELLNRWLTRQGSQGIPRALDATTPPQPPIPPQVRKVGGLTEDEFIEDLCDAGLTEGEARSKWRQATEAGLLPYQMEGELPS